MIGTALLMGLSAVQVSAQPALNFEDSMAQRSLACTHCHGDQGRAGPDGYYPRIAGKPAGYLYNQLLHFRDGRRHYAPMTGLLDTLSDAYLMDLARHFASLDLPYPPAPPGKVAEPMLQRGQQLALRGDPTRQISACTACHGSRLTGVLPDVPGLLGLPRDYINAQLGAWRNGKRRAHAPDCMAEVARALNPQDIEAVSSWLATQSLPADPRPAASAPQRAAASPCGSAALSTRARP
jgi:cytochrome c553